MNLNDRVNFFSFLLTRPLMTLRHTNKKTHRREEGALLVLQAFHRHPVGINLFFTEQILLSFDILYFRNLKF